MESVITDNNLEKALELLSGELYFEELIELSSGDYPKGADKKAEGEGWSLWVKDGLNYVVVLGVGVFLALT